MLIFQQSTAECHAHSNISLDPENSEHLLRFSAVLIQFTVQSEPVQYQLCIKHHEEMQIRSGLFLVSQRSIPQLQILLMYHYTSKLSFCSSQILMEQGPNTILSMFMP